MAQKNGTVFWHALTSSNINRFSKLFHCQNQEKICNYIITKDPTTPQVCCYKKREKQTKNIQNIQKHLKFTQGIHSSQSSVNPTLETNRAVLPDHL